MNSVADGDDITGSSHVKVRPCEGDEARVGHSMLIPAHHHTAFCLKTNQFMDETCGLRNEILVIFFGLF